MLIVSGIWEQSGLQCGGIGEFRAVGTSETQWQLIIPIASSLRMPSRISKAHG